jgi:hypothetical protein
MPGLIFPNKLGAAAGRCKMAERQSYYYTDDSKILAVISTTLRYQKLE